MQVLSFHCLTLLSAKQFTFQDWKGTCIGTMLLPQLKSIFGQFLASFGYFFGILGFLVPLPMHFPVILTQFVAMRCKRAALKMLRGGDNFGHHGCAR